MEKIYPLLVYATSKLALFVQSTSLYRIQLSKIPIWPLFFLLPFLTKHLETSGSASSCMFQQG